jgi:hypothetical protein
MRNTVVMPAGRHALRRKHWGAQYFMTGGEQETAIPTVEEGNRMYFNDKER